MKTVIVVVIVKIISYNLYNLNGVYDEHSSLLRKALFHKRMHLKELHVLKEIKKMHVKYNDYKYLREMTPIG